MNDSSLNIPEFRKAEKMRKLEKSINELKMKVDMTSIWLAEMEVSIAEREEKLRLLKLIDK